MHGVEFQNWLNHARSVGYTDTEIRTLLLKAGWPTQQVNELMVARGLTPGTAHPNVRGRIVNQAARSPYSTLSISLLIGVAVITLVALLFAILQ